MLNKKAVFQLISKSDYEAMCYLLQLISIVDGNCLKNTLIRNREISDLRKCIIKAVIDRFPKFHEANIAKQLKCTQKAVKASYIQANILYSNDSNFAQMFDNFIK
jgi:hypothetical protein